MLNFELTGTFKSNIYNLGTVQTDGVKMFKIRSSRITLNVSIKFEPTIFDWQNVPGKFFELIQSALTSIVTTDSLRDFMIQSGNTVGDFEAKFKIYGGPSSITLSADNLSFNFPNLIPTDNQLVLQIIKEVHTSFYEKFNEQSHSLVRIGIYVHAELVDGNSQDDYLSRYSTPYADSVAKDSNWEIQPSGRISIIGKDRSWRATCMVENSELVENALFLQFDLTQEISQKHTFENILDSYRRISYTCMSLLDLQQVNE